MVFAGGFFASNPGWPGVTAAGGLAATAGTGFEPIDGESPANFGGG